MATGIEIAGFALAAFPIVISYLEHYRSGLETLKEWWKFRTEFLSFLNEVGVQYVFYTENLEALLAPIVPSDVEMKALLDDPGGPPWQDPTLEQRLKERLPKSYDWYRLRVEAIDNILENMKKRLGIKPGTTSTMELKAKGKIRWEYEFARIRFTLGKKTRETLLERLAKYNDQLRKLLGSSEKLADSRLKRRSLPFAVHYARVRDHAHGLHQLLISEWRCDCRQSHNANLLLENRIKSGFQAEHDASVSADLEFNVLLYFGGNVPDQQSRWTWHETRIQVSRSLGPLLSMPDKISQRPKNISGAIESLVSLPPSTPNQQKRVSFAPQGQSVSTLHLPSSSNPSKPTTPSPPSPYEEQDVAKIANLCDAIGQAQKKNGCLGFLLDEKERRYTFFPVVELAVHPSKLEIVTLEDLLQDRQTANDGGVRQTHILSRRERLYIATLLSISLLQLHSTPWLAGTWTKKDIFFTRVKDDPSAPIDTSRLYVSPPVGLDGTKIRPSRAEDSGNSATRYLFALGVMLLELCFGNRLEDNPARQLYLGKDGKPNDWTDLATASHWQKSALGEIGPDYAEAIRKCIFCAFPHPYEDLSDHRFSEAIHSEVVEPIKATLQHFDPSAWQD